jgi:DNA-binding transcriptional MerR regulator
MTTYHPIDLARLAGVSTASVRAYERDGFLPAAERSASGHRRYGEVHLDALLASRTMMAGYGWAYAQRVMRAVHTGRVAEALALVDARHAAMDQERRRVAATIEALEQVARQPGVSRAAPLRIGAAARWAGVEVSALRFWEQEALLHPSRDPGSNYRLYDPEDLRRLRVVVVLRDAGYGVEAIRGVLRELSNDNPEAVLAEVRKRQDQLTRLSLACMRATAALSGYLARHGERPDTT